jgi:hypothetical protein
MYDKFSGLELVVNQAETASEATADTASINVSTTHPEQDLAPHDLVRHRPRVPHCISCTCAIPNQGGSSVHNGGSIPSVSQSGRWYMVSRGRNVGIFNEWSISFFFLKYNITILYFRHTVFSLVNGISGSCHKRYPSKAAAQAAFIAATEAGEVAFLV